MVEMSSSHKEYPFHIAKPSVVSESLSDTQIIMTFLKRMNLLFFVPILVACNGQTRLLISLEKFMGLI